MESSYQNLGKYPLHQYSGSKEFIALIDSIPLAVLHPQQSTRYLKFVFFTYLALSDRGLPERVRASSWGRILLYGWRHEVPKSHLDLAVEHSESVLSESGVSYPFAKLDTLEATPHQVSNFITEYFHPDYHKRIQDLLVFLHYLATYQY